MKALLLLISVFCLGSGSVVAETSDFLPLAVGNSWTYEHDYYDYENDEADRQNWPDWAGAQFPPQFTISVLRTEVITDTTYYVISEMPELWPPAPSYFIAGKKLRWSGDQLMERTDDGEQSLYRFSSGASGASGSSRPSYSVDTPEGYNKVTIIQSGRFFFDLDEGASGASSESETYGGPIKHFPYALGGTAFLKGFGIKGCSDERGSGDAPLFINYLTAKHAVIDGRTWTVEGAEAALRSSSSDSSVEGLSWARIKQEVSQ